MQKNIKEDKLICFWLKLIIRGENIDFKRLTNLLGICPTDTYKWNGTKNAEPLDAWYYRIKIESTEQLEALSLKFFDTISVVRKLKNDHNYKPEIVFCIHSDMAQIYFDLPKSIIKYLEKLEIPIAFSILSWGMVEDRND